MNMIFDSKRRWMIVGSIKLIIFVNVHSSPNQIIAISPLSGSTQYIFSFSLVLFGSVRYCSALLRDYPLHYTHLPIITRVPLVKTLQYTLLMQKKNEVTYHVVIVLLRSFN